MRKIFKIFVPILLVFILCTSMLPITAQAEEISDSVQLLIKGSIDPRVKAMKEAVFVTFMNKYDGTKYEFYLYDYNDYMTTVEVTEGDYTMYSGVVTGDLEFKYPVHPISFYAEGWAMDITIVVGDPNYKGEIEENNDRHDFPGAIDRDKTNELLKEDGLPEVDWEKHDNDRFPDTDGDGIIDYDDTDDDNDGIPDDKDDDKDGDGIKNEDEYTHNNPWGPNPAPEQNYPVEDDDEKNEENKIKDTDGDGIPDDQDDDDDNDGVPDNEDTDKDGNGIEDTEEKQDDEDNPGGGNTITPGGEDNKEKEGSKTGAIIFIVILVLGCGIVIFLKFKNSLEE